MSTRLKTSPAAHRDESARSEATDERRPRRRVFVGFAVAILVFGGGTGAFAYWTSVGHGQGSATSGSTSPFTVTSTPATGAPMTPGGPTDSVAFTVTNPGTGSEMLNAVAVTVANQADGTPWTATPGCSAADYTLGVPVITYGQIAPGGTVSGTVSITMNNRSANQNACQAQSVPLYFAVS